MQAGGHAENVGSQISGTTPQRCGGTEGRPFQPHRQCSGSFPAP